MGEGKGRGQDDGKKPREKDRLFWLPSGWG